MSASSGAMQLRYLQTLADMSNGNASTIVFPLPIEMMKTMMARDGGVGGGGDDAPGKS
jgi:hypothetical protein